MMLKKMMVLCLILSLITGCSKAAENSGTAVPSDVVEGAQEPEKQPAAPASPTQKEPEEEKTPAKTEDPAPEKPAETVPGPAPKPADPEPEDEEPEEEEQKPVTLPKLKPDPAGPVTAVFGGAVITIEDGVLAMEGDIPTLTVTCSYTNLGSRWSTAHSDIYVGAGQLEDGKFWFDADIIRMDKAFDARTEVGETKRFSITFSLEYLVLDEDIQVSAGPSYSNPEGKYDKEIYKWFRVVK